MNIMPGILALIFVAALAGIGLFKHFVTDRGGVENPDAVGKAEENREIPETAELVEFSWHQSAMNFDDCFFFKIDAAGQGAPTLYCAYTDEETGARIEIGDGDYEKCPPVPLDCRAALLAFLRKAELPAYRAPNPGLLDATDSFVSVTWREDGEQFTNNYDGMYAHDLLKLLKDIAQEANAAMPELTSDTEQIHNRK